MTPEMTIDELWRKAARECAAFGCQSYSDAIRSVIAPEIESRDAEIERYRSMLTNLTHQRDTSYSTTRQQSARIAELEQHVAELRKDAERYRFLRAKELPACVDLFECHGEGSWELKSEDRLDSAIDAALQQENSK